MRAAVISKDVSDIRRLISGSNVFLVTDGIIHSLYPEILSVPHMYVMEAGESFKRLSTVEAILASMTASGCNRKTTLVAVGGGVVGDTAGFAASVFMRGIKWINVPTTLLAQVDSGIGGKTGVDIDNYKNIAGSFWMPEAVHIRTDFLKTLPTREWICGMGEVVKHAAISPKVFAFVRSNFDALMLQKEEFMLKAVELNARCKEKIVRADFKEKKLRKRLNAGHTVGHAVEKLDRFKLSHGKYVAMGLWIEMNMFKELIEPKFFAAITDMAKRVCSEVLKLPVKDIAAAARADKKNSDGMISFIIPTRVGKVTERLISVDETIRRLEKCLSGR